MILPAPDNPHIRRPKCPLWGVNRTWRDVPGCRLDIAPLSTSLGVKARSGHLSKMIWVA
jgi:hypothetical protein